MNQRKIITFLGALVLELFSYNASGQNGIWTTNITHITPRALGAAATVGGEVYMVGGGNWSCGVNSTLQVYGSTANVWTNLPSMPTARYEFAAAELNGQLYALGGNPGCGSPGQAFRTVEAYDPVANTWSTKATLPSASWGLGAASVNGILYVVDGFNNNTYCYDPTTNGWSTKSACPVSFSSGVMAAVNGMIYCITCDGTTSHTYAYNPTGDVWTAKSPMPTVRTAFTGAALNGIIYVAGGYNGGQLATNVVYNPLTDSWSSASSLPSPVDSASAAAANGSLYVMGGFDGSHNTLGNVAVFTPSSVNVTNIYQYIGVETNITLNPGTYIITAYGAQGGNGNGGPGGLGAEMSGRLTFSAFTTLTLLVGGVGYSSGGGGGGGGSFAVNGSTPLVVAGGGGGGGYSSAGLAGVTGTNGGAGDSGFGGGGGIGGGGGYASTWGSSGAGGGGFYSGGGGGSYGAGGGGSFLSGGSGGGGGSGSFAGGNGGFGGGGGGVVPGGGGGGGYSGGGSTQGYYGGGGGGSIIDSSAIQIGTELAGVRSGNGEIDIVTVNAGAPAQVLTNVVVSPNNPLIGINSNQQFTATGYFNDGSSQTLASNVTWNSSSLSVATITANGLASGLTAGTTTITAIFGSVSNSITLTVVAGLTNLVVGPAGSIIAASSNLQFTATGIFNDGSALTLSSNLTWASSNPFVATINTNGIATGLAAGITTIKAISGSLSNSASLTVVAIPSISTQPTNHTIFPNGSITLSVAATGGNLSYQWRLNGTNIAGATSAIYNIPSVAFTNVGVYTVVVSNLAGSVTSRAAIVGTTAIEMFAGIIVNGPIGTNYLIQAGSNLGVPTNWTTLTNITLPTQPYIYIDYSTPFNSQQFYRAVPQ